MIDGVFLIPHLSFAFGYFVQFDTVRMGDEVSWYLCFGDVIIMENGVKAQCNYKCNKGDMQKDKYCLFMW